MSVWEGKRYKLEKSVNFDEYMEALGRILCLKQVYNTLLLITFFSVPPQVWDGL